MAHGSAWTFQIMSTGKEIIIAAVAFAGVLSLCAWDGATALEMIGVSLLLAVVMVPCLMSMAAKNKRLEKEQEALKQKCDEMKSRGGACDWSKARGGTLRYPAPYLDHGLRKAFHTGKIKEARKPPSADAP